MDQERSPRLRVTLEILKGYLPVRGVVTCGSGDPKPFWGWSELRLIVHSALGIGDVTAGMLTATETRIVSLVGEGLSNPEIARLLGVSSRTVQGHLYRVFKKLGVQSRTQLVSEWLDHTAGVHQVRSVRDLPVASMKVESFDSREGVTSRRMTS